MPTKEYIEEIASQLLPSFIPRDKSETELSFHFTIPPNQSFKVWFKKKDSNWQFEKYEEDQRPA